MRAAGTLPARYRSSAGAPYSRLFMTSRVSPLVDLSIVLSAFSLLFLTGFCALLMKGRDFPAGLILAMQAFKPHLLLLPAALLLIKGRWKALGGLVLGGLLILGFTLLTVGTRL